MPNNNSLDSRPLILGLDTGGTHTDAVVYDPGPGRVLATAKAMTTHHELSLGLINALKTISGHQWPGGLQAIGRVSLSTTLATNAVAEGLGGRVGLVLIGYEAGQAATDDLTRDLDRASPIFIQGGHDYYGRPLAPLDLKTLETEVQKIAPEVEGWAVSGFFSVKNPQHEMEAAGLIKNLSPAPVTMGRDLTGQLDAVRRAATAALNASLVLIINRLLDAVKTALAELGLQARLMVARGDGSLVSADWARARPIETLVSGPAAGLVGARELTRGLMGTEPADLWVMDVGGTTTDLAYLDQGRPVISRDGAKVGRWRTMTEAVDTRTRGLGGDSLVSVDRTGRLTLGPRRVLPLCRLAKQWPEVEKILERSVHLPLSSEQATCFFVPGAPPGPGLSETETLILERLAQRTPYPLVDLIRIPALTRGHFGGLQTLLHPAVLPAAFTPTDAMAVLGLFNGGSAGAALTAAARLAKDLQTSPEELCRRILDEFGRLLAEEIITHACHLSGLAVPKDVFRESGLLGQALGRRASSIVDIACRFKAPLVLMGAPAAVLAPWLDKYLGARLVVPPAFDVASAVGAAGAPIQLRRLVELHTLPGFSGYRLFLPDRVLESANPETLVEEARRLMADHLGELIRLAGAEKAEIGCERVDRRVVLRDGSRLFLGATLTFTARAG
jgi:N-methylhydantoinase A/oxoprolinase/acetone carboxylase beta subunit